MACIFKVHDDCRQDTMTIQVVRLLRDLYATLGLPVYMYPYSVIPNRTGPEKSIGGILQVVPNVKSRDNLVRRCQTCVYVWAIFVVPLLL